MKDGTPNLTDSKNELYGISVILILKPNYQNFVSLFHNLSQIELIVALTLISWIGKVAIRSHITTNKTHYGLHKEKFSLLFLLLE